MIEEIKLGQFVKWVEEPHLEGPIMPSALLGQQVGEVIRIVKSKSTGLVRICVKNTNGKNFHWIEGESALDNLSLAMATA